MGDAHDHDELHEDWDPFWANSEQMLDEEEPDEYYELGHCEVVERRDKALLVNTNHYGQLWFPWSQVHRHSEIKRDNDEVAGKFVVNGWLAKKRGWL